MKNIWKTEKLIDVFQIKPSKNEVKHRLSDNDLVSFVPMEDLGILAKDFTTTKEKHIKEVSGSYTYFSNNDVLLAKITPCFENGKLGIARNLKNGVGFGSSEFIVFRSKGQIIPEYLFYLLCTNDFRECGKKRMSGAVGHKRIQKEFIENYLISFPESIEEQQRIVAILDKAFYAIEKAKSNAEQNLQNVKELFKSYLNALFETENNEWKITTLNEISENLDNRRVPITKSRRIKGSIPYYGASGIVDYVENYLFDEELLCVSEDGANLLARTYPIAFSISGKTWVNNHAHVLRFKNIFSQKFVELYLNSIKLDDFVSGMAQPKLNQAMLNKIPIPFPSIEKQQSIVHTSNLLRAEVLKKEANCQAKIDKAEELKKSLLQKAFSGELITENIDIYTQVQA